MTSSHAGPFILTRCSPDDIPELVKVQYTCFSGKSSAQYSYVFATAFNAASTSQETLRFMAFPALVFSYQR